MITTKKVSRFNAIQCFNNTSIFKVWKIARYLSNSQKESTSDIKVKSKNIIFLHSQGQFFESLVSHSSRNPRTPIFLTGRPSSGQDAYTRAITECLKNTETQKMEKEEKNPSSLDQKSALILTPNKLSTMQIYSKLRQCNIDNNLKISRLGSICHLSPHIEFIVK